MPHSSFKNPEQGSHVTWCFSDSFFFAGFAEAQEGLRGRGPNVKRREEDIGLLERTSAVMESTRSYSFTDHVW